MTNAKFVKWLKEHHACDEAVKWVQEHGGTLQECWNDCEWWGWMYWLCVETHQSRRKIANALKKYSKDLSKEEGSHQRADRLFATMLREKFPIIKIT